MINSRRHRCFFNTINIVILITFLCSNLSWASEGGPGFILANKLSAPSQVTSLVPIANTLAIGQRAIKQLADARISTKDEFYKRLEGELRKSRLENFTGIPCLLFSDKDDPSKLAYYVFSSSEPYFSRITTHTHVNDPMWDLLRIFNIDKRFNPEIGERVFNEKGRQYYQRVFVLTNDELVFINSCLKKFHPDWEIRVRSREFGINYRSDKPWGAKLSYPHIPDLREYGGKGFSVQPRWVPRSTKGMRQVIGEDELMSLVLSPGWKVVITRDYDEMTYASLYIIVKLMEMAESEFCFGLATGGTTESLRKAMGLVELSRDILNGLSIPADKIKLWETLDNYYWPLGSDPRTVAIGSYFQEQNYMLLENLYGETKGLDYFIAPPDVTGMSWQETAQEFARRMSIFMDEAYKILVQLHGIGSSGHDAFNEVFIRLKRAEQRIVIDLRKYVDIPEAEPVPSFFSTMGLMRQDHGTVVLDITRVQNIGHITEKSFHPFFLRFMADNILLDIPELLARLSAMSIEEISTYYPEPRYRFLSERDFIMELQYFLDNYKLTPRFAVTQGTGDIALRTAHNDSVNLFMVCSPHKQEPFRRAIELKPSRFCTASWLQLAASAIVIATVDSAGKIDWSRCFLFEPRNKSFSICTEKNIEDTWRKTKPGEKIMSLLKEHGDVMSERVYEEYKIEPRGFSQSDLAIAEIEGLGIRYYIPQGRMADFIKEMEELLDNEGLIILLELLSIAFEYLYMCTADEIFYYMGGLIEDLPKLLKRCPSRTERAEILKKKVEDLKKELLREDMAKEALITRNIFTWLARAKEDVYKEEIPMSSFGEYSIEVMPNVSREIVSFSIEPFVSEDKELMKEWYEYARKNKIAKVPRFDGWKYAVDGFVKGFKLITIDSKGKKRIEGWVTYDEVIGEGLFELYRENAPWNGPHVRDREIKGVATAIIKRVIEESIFCGYNGRIVSIPSTEHGILFAERTYKKPTYTPQTQYGKLNWSYWTLSPSGAKEFLEDYGKKVAKSRSRVLVLKGRNQSQYSRVIKEGREEKLLKMNVDDLGKIGESEIMGGITGLAEILKEEDIEKDIKVAKERLQDELDKLKKEFGVGIFGAVKEIVLVDNLGGLDSPIKDEKGAVAVFQGGVMLIDIDAFRDRLVLRDVLAHELWESILELVESNPGIREVTAIYQNLKAFVAMPEERQEELIEFLSQKDNGLESKGYAELLKYIIENKIIDDALISLAVSYVLSEPRYTHLKGYLGGILHEDIKKTEEKLVLAMEIYEDLTNELGNPAPPTNLPILYRDVAIDLIGLDVIQTLASKDMRDIKVFYEKEIEEEIRGRGRDIRCFGIRDMDGGKGKWAFYVIDFGNNEFIRFLSSKDVNDRFFYVLNMIEKLNFISEDIYRPNGKEYIKQRFKITDKIRPFIKTCLDMVYYPDRVYCPAGDFKKDIEEIMEALIVKRDPKLIFLPKELFLRLEELIIREERIDMKSLGALYNVLGGYMEGAKTWDETIRGMHPYRHDVRAARCMKDSEELLSIVKSTITQNREFLLCLFFKEPKPSKYNYAMAVNMEGELELSEYNDRYYIVYKEAEVIEKLSGLGYIGGDGIVVVQSGDWKSAGHAGAIPGASVFLHTHSKGLSTKPSGSDTKYWRSCSSYWFGRMEYADLDLAIEFLSKTAQPDLELDVFFSSLLKYKPREETLLLRWGEEIDSRELKYLYKYISDMDYLDEGMRAYLIMKLLFAIVTSTLDIKGYDALKPFADMILLDDMEGGSIKEHAGEFILVSDPQRILSRKIIGLLDEIGSEVPSEILNFIEMFRARCGFLFQDSLDIEKAEGLKVIRTFKGVRIIGQVSDMIRRLVGYIVRDENWSLPEGLDIKRTRYIVVDKDRMRDELKDVINGLKKYNIEVVYEVPEDVDMDDLVILVDPEDVLKWEGKGMIYLPLPYMKISLYLAAELVISGRDDIKNTHVYKFVKGFYELLLDEKFSSNKVLDLFYKPWWFLPKIQNLSKELSVLRQVITQLEKFA